MTWDRTSVLPPSVVCPWSGVYLRRLNQMDEALGAGKEGKGGGLGTWFQRLGKWQQVGETSLVGMEFLH